MRRTEKKKRHTDDSRLAGLVLPGQKLFPSVSLFGAMPKKGTTNKTKQQKKRAPDKRGRREGENKGNANKLWL